MKSEVMPDETLNAVCGIFEKPKMMHTPLSKTAVLSEWMKRIKYRWPVVRFANPVNQDHGYDDPLKSVYREPQ